jgi:hypothetical protein
MKRHLGTIGHRSTRLVGHRCADGRRREAIGVDIPRIGPGINIERRDAQGIGAGAAQRNIEILHTVAIIDQAAGAAAAHKVGRFGQAHTRLLYHAIRHGTRAEVKAERQRLRALNGR